MLEQLFRTALDFEYRIRYSARKTIAIHVGKNGVEVRAPVGTSELWIHQFVVNKAHWIEKKLAEQKHRRSQMCRIQHGGSFWFMGKSLNLIYRYGRSRRVELTETDLIVQLTAQSPVDLLSTPDEAATKLVSEWLRHQARDYMVHRTFELAKRIRVDHLLNEVRFRKTRSKWGHCSSKGIIQFNWQIMMAPQEVIQYLICHEVSHLVHMNHSQAFWRQVEAICPDYAGQEAWLRENESRLQWV